MTEASQDSCRVLILTADAGMGHRSAAEAIQAAIAELYPNCIAEIVNPLDDERVPGVLRERQTSYDDMVRSSRELYELGYRAADTEAVGVALDGALVLMLFRVLKDLIEALQSDVVISTYPLYQAAMDAVRQVEEASWPILNVVTDLATVNRLWFSKASDLVLVPNETVKERALEYDVAEERIRVTGLPVDPEFSKDLGELRKLREELGWDPDRVTLLVVGSKRVLHLPEILEVVDHSGHPLQLILLSGGDEELRDEFEKRSWHLPVHIYGFVDEMPKFMQASDIVMSKAGGLIVSESLACGRPLLLVDVLPGQEVGNAEIVVNAGAGELAEEPVEVLKTLCHWLEDDRALLSERSINAKELGRPRAAYNVAELARDVARQGPPVPRTNDHALRDNLLQFLDERGILSD
ncbi:MAG: MGDG synthase family glycosyltransferase [Anaerolineae bacterium]